MRGSSPRMMALSMTKTTRPKLVTALLLAPAALFFVFLLLVPLTVVLIFSFGERAPAGG